MDIEELNEILKCEYKRVKENGILDFGIDIKIENDNYTKWIITMTAPEDSDYSGGKYTVIAEFTTDYPLVNPKFIFQKPVMYHCNVDNNNELKVNWLMKGMKIDYILPRLLTLFYLQDPNIDEVSEKCKLYKENEKECKKNIKKNVEETREKK